MSEERDDDDPTKVAQPGAGASPPPAGPPSPLGPIEELRDKMTDAATEFLKSRLGLEQGLDGTLKFPTTGTFESFGERADQFVRGFFRGFVAKTPEEREVAAGLRDPKDVPTGTEVAARLLGNVSDTMSQAFHQYLHDNVVDDQKPGEQVVVDGRFVLRHAAPLLATFVQALGTRFGDTNVNAAKPDSAAAEPKPHVDYRVDLPSVFKSLFVRPSDPGDTGGTKA